MGGCFQLWDRGELTELVLLTLFSSPISHRKQLPSSLVQMKGMYPARGYRPQQVSMSSLPAMNSNRGRGRGWLFQRMRAGQARRGRRSRTGREGGTGRTDKHGQAQEGAGSHEQEHSWPGRTGRGAEGTRGRGVLILSPRTLPASPRGSTRDTPPPWGLGTAQRQRHYPPKRSLDYKPCPGWEPAHRSIKLTGKGRTRSWSGQVSLPQAASAPRSRAQRERAPPGSPANCGSGLDGEDGWHGVLLSFSLLPRATGVTHG